MTRCGKEVRECMNCAYTCLFQTYYPLFRPSTAFTPLFFFQNCWWVRMRNWRGSAGYGWEERGGQSRWKKRAQEWERRRRSRNPQRHKNSSKSKHFLLRVEIRVCIQTKHRKTSKTNCDKVRPAHRGPEHAPITSPGQRAVEERRGRVGITPWSQKRDMWECSLTEKKETRLSWGMCGGICFHSRGWTTSIIQHTLKITLWYLTE